jgi:hypothetical protein
MYMTLPIGCAGLNCATGTARGRSVLAGADRRALGARLSRAVENCARGGTRTVSCDGNTQTILYDLCAEPSESGANTVERDGTVTLAVENKPDFCTVGPPFDAENDRTRVTFSDYVQTERNASANVVGRLTVAVLTETFVPTGVDCGATEEESTIEGVQVLDGAFDIQCNPAAESIACPFAEPSAAFTTNVLLTATNLRIARASGGNPCQLGVEITGRLNVNDRILDANYTQNFETTDAAPNGFAMTETFPDGQGRTQVTQRGRLSVDCLGGLLVSDRARDDEGGPDVPLPALRFQSGLSCPTAGELQVARAPIVAEPPAAASASLLVPRAGPTPAVQDFRMRLFRAVGGQVYQVIENLGEQVDFGADAVQITSLIGSEAGSVGNCANTAGGTSKAQAVVGAESGTAFPPTSAFKSAIIPFAGNVVFNRNAPAATGEGQVCIGPGCQGGATCPNLQQCRMFSISQGVPLTEPSAQIPAAQLVEPLVSRPEDLEDPCSGFARRTTYRFGLMGPTVQTVQCRLFPEAPQGDGFRLRNNESVVIAYGTSLAALFNAAVAGFPVDLDGTDPEDFCGGPGRVLHLGSSDLDSVPGPRIQFTDTGGVLFDFDDDRVPDGQRFSSCNQLSVLSQCRQAE